MPRMSFRTFAALLSAVVVFASLSIHALDEKDKKGEILDNEKLIEMIHEDVQLQDILDQIQNSKCDFRHDTKALIDIQKACKEAKWKPEEISKLHKKVGEMAIQGQRDLKKLVFLFLGACQNLSAIDERMTDAQYQQQKKALIIVGSAAVPIILENLVAQAGSKDGVAKCVGLLDVLDGIGEKSQKTLTAVMLMLDDPNKPVRAQAALTLKSLAVPETAEALLKKLDHNEALKDGVAFALGYLKCQKAIEPLVQMLKMSNDVDERVAAAYALGYMRARTPAAQEALLLGILDEKDEKIRLTCAVACTRIGLTDAPAHIMKSYNRFRQGRRDMIQTLDTIHDVKAADFLADHLEDDDNEIRRYALETLERLTHEKYERKEDWKAFIELLPLRPGWSAQTGVTNKLPDADLK